VRYASRAVLTTQDPCCSSRSSNASISLAYKSLPSDSNSSVSVFSMMALMNGLTFLSVFPNVSDIPRSSFIRGDVTGESLSTALAGRRFRSRSKWFDIVKDCFDVGDDGFPFLYGTTSSLAGGHADCWRHATPSARITQKLPHTGSGNICYVTSSQAHRCSLSRGGRYLMYRPMSM
jgi:hypothetical protein